MRKKTARGSLTLVLAFSLVIGMACFTSAAGRKPEGKVRILVVSSYHPEYRWSQETARGFSAAMLQFGYFDRAEQVGQFLKDDEVETSRAIVRKLWLDAKRKSDKAELESRGLHLFRIAKQFDPDLILLGDDDAVNYVGSKFLDAGIPVVFWGVNNTPVKYGLVESAERPGHNVTGVYQSGYYIESLQLLKRIAPTVRTFAVLSDATATGRSHYKAIEYLARTGKLPLKLVETVSTGEFDTWKARALELQKRVDAFFIAQYSGLKDGAGNYVPPAEVARWYGEHITIPEAVEQRQFIEEGMLCGADDSGYNQAFDAVAVARDILEKGADPATYPVRAPKRGAFMVNAKRAAALGIALTQGMGIEEIIQGKDR